MECRQHKGIYTIRQMHDKGPLEGQYGMWCPACREWCDECPEHKAEVKASPKSGSES